MTNQTDINYEELERIVIFFKRTSGDSINRFKRKVGGLFGNKRGTKTQLISIIEKMSLTKDPQETDDLMKLLQRREVVYSEIPHPSIGTQSGVYKTFRLTQDSSGRYHLEYGTRINPNLI